MTSNNTHNTRQPPKILILGAQGQVGFELRRVLASIGQIFALTRHQLDLSKLEQVANYLNELKPNYVINAAAYTQVDLAETQQEQAQILNTHLPALLADYCQENSALLVHYSTDYVFDGSTSIPYQEDDVANPLNIYGQTKWAGEQAILQRCPRNALIIRTCWVYAARGKNFFLTINRLLHEKEELRIVADQWGAPTSARLIAETTGQMVYNYQKQEPTQHSCFKHFPSDIYHLSGAGDASWYDFACEIARQTAFWAPQKTKHIKAVTTAEYPTPSKRPLNTRLNCQKIIQQFSLHLPPWQESLALVIEEYFANMPLAKRTHCEPFERTTS